MFPETPHLLLTRLRQSKMPTAWERSWEEFFTLYYRVVATCLRHNFRKYNWHGVDESVIEDEAMKIFADFHRKGLGFSAEKGNFRSLLQTVCQRRVVDYIRHSNRRISEIPATVNHEGDPMLEAEGTLSQEQFSEELDRQFRDALLLTLLAALRKEVSPRIFLIFERVKILGESPDEVAEDLGIKRGVVDNSIYKAMNKLRALAAEEDFLKEMEQ